MIVRSRAMWSVRRMMAAVAVVALSLAAFDAARMAARSWEYRRKADSVARMARRSREIDAMDPATRAREADAAFDNPFLDDPAWNRRMIPYLDGLEAKYRRAAEHPRSPVPRDPPIP